MGYCIELSRPGQRKTGYRSAKWWSQREDQPAWNVFLLDTYLNHSQYRHLQEDLDKERQTRLEYQTKLESEKRFWLCLMCIMFSRTQLLQAESAHLRESINQLKEEREKDALEKERLLKEKEEEFNKEKANLERRQEEFKLQMDERIFTLSSQLENLQQELDSKQQALSKQNSLVRIRMLIYQRLSMEKLSCVVSNKRWRKPPMQQRQHKRKGKFCPPKTSSWIEKCFFCVM